MTEIEIVELAAQDTAVVRERVPVQDLPRFFGRAFDQVAAALGRQGVAPAGPPFACYHGMPGASVDVEAGFPVAAPIWSAGDVAPGRLPACRAAQAVHVGPYDSLELTYAEVQESVEAHGGSLTEDMWESYLSDPGSEPDPSRWRTLVTCPMA